MADWMLYGAYGYTGKLLLAEAVRRGHRPVLAGRNSQKLRSVAEAHGLDWLAFSLTDAASLADCVQDFGLVFHAAGPFTRTAAPMRQACIAGQAHYLDVTGEIAVFEGTFAADGAAREAGIALISGAGFDVVPTDCLAKYVADQLPGATHLETAVATTVSKISSGTAKTALDQIGQGGFIRLNDRLVPLAFGAGGKTIPFSDGRARHVIPVPLGDLAAAPRTTGLPNVTTYVHLQIPALPGFSSLAAVGRRILRLPPVKWAAQKAAGLLVAGPDEAWRQSARCYLYARVTDPAGQFVEAWLETPEIYHFTAVAGIRAVEKTLPSHLQGALTPALAFGADFVLEMEGTTRWDRLPVQGDGDGV